jgi:acyl dehydratase
VTDEALMTRSLYFEDLQPGLKVETAAATVTDRDVAEFALRFDPQPMHLDAETAAGNQFGGLIASGFHTLSLGFALFFRLDILRDSNLGSPGMEEVRWVRPLRPGDTVHMIAEVTAARASQSKPDRGVVWMRHDLYNQRGELVMSANCMHMVRRAV